MKATTEDGKGYQANVSETSESAEEEEEARLVDVEPADTTDFGMDSDVDIPKVIQTVRVSPGRSGLRSDRTSFPRFARSTGASGSLLCSVRCTSSA